MRSAGGCYGTGVAKYGAAFSGPNRVERCGLAVTMRGTLIAVASAGGFRSVIASPMAGPGGLGCFADTIRCGIAGDWFRFRARRRRKA